MAENKTNKTSLNQEEAAAADLSLDANERSMKVYEDNDRFFDVLWQNIDDSKDIICIGTYAMDHKNVAGITLQKLKNAAKRGVKVFLVIDDLCFYANKD